MARVMLVEDDKNLRELYALGLERAGYKVIAASCGTDTLRMLNNSQLPDLFILDVSLPGMTGLDLMDEIRRVYNHKAKIILNTEYDRYEDIPRARQADAIVLKSGDLTELIETAGKLLQTGSPTR